MTEGQLPVQQQQPAVAGGTNPSYVVHNESFHQAPVIQHNNGTAHGHGVHKETAMKVPKVSDYKAPAARQPCAADIVKGSLGMQFKFNRNGATPDFCRSIFHRKK